MADIVRRLSSSDPDFDAALTALTAWDVSEDDAVTRAARDIVAAVRTRGDEALLEYTRRFDRLTCASVAELELGPDELARVRCMRCPNRSAPRCRKRRSEFARFTKRSARTASKSPMRSAIGSAIG